MPTLNLTVNGVAHTLDQHLGPVKTELLGQPDGLGAPGPEDLRGFHRALQYEI